MENTSDEEHNWPKRQNFRNSMEKIKAQASEILKGIPQMNVLLEQNAMIEAKLEKRSQELELQEKELESLRLDLEKRCKTFEEEKAEAGNLKKTVEECKEELRSTRNQLTAKVETSKMIQGEIDSKSKQLEKIMAELRRRCSEARTVEDRKKEMEGETDRKMKELALILDKIKESDKELELKETKLREVTEEIARRCIEVEERKKEMEEETDKKLSGEQLVTVDEQIESRRRLLEMHSLELASKEKELESLRESIKLCNSDIGLKEKMVQSLNKTIAVCGKGIDSKSEELGKIQKLIEKQANERDNAKLFIQVLSEELVAKENKHREILETINRSNSEMEERAKEIKAAEAKASELKLKSEWLRQEVEGKAMELNLLKNQIESEEKNLDQLKREMEEETDRKKRDLLQLISIIEDSVGKQLKAMDAQLEFQRRQLEIHSLELVAKEKQHKEILEDIRKRSSEIESIKTVASELNEQSESFRSYVEDREKELDQLKNQLKSEENELTRLRKSIQECTSELSSRRDEVEAVKKIQSELESKKQMRQTSSVLVRHEQQLASLNPLRQLNASGKLLERRYQEVELLMEKLEVLSLEVKKKGKVDKTEADGLRKEIEDKGEEVGDKSNNETCERIRLPIVYTYQKKKEAQSPEEKANLGEISI